MLDPASDSLARVMESVKARDRELAELIRKAVAELEADPIFAKARAEAVAYHAALRREVESAMPKPPPARPD